MLVGVQEDNVVLLLDLAENPLMVPEVIMHFEEVIHDDLLHHSVLNSTKDEGERDG